jgi:hypothetical protein
MNYILVDNLNGNINIICKNDDSGEPLLLESIENAIDFLEENCQDGIIVPLADSFELLRRINGLFNSGKLYLEEETEEDSMNFLQLKLVLKYYLGEDLYS